MDECQAIEKQQVFDFREVHGGGRFGEQEILGIPGVATDQQGHVIHQFCHRTQAQRLTVSRGLIGDRHASEQKRIHAA
ncbi:hypothetical protein D3C76_1813110 [compost metagenome]